MRLKPPVCIVPSCKEPAGGLMCAKHWAPLPRELKDKLLAEKRGIERSGAKRSTAEMTRLVLEAERVADSGHPPAPDGGSRE